MTTYIVDQELTHDALPEWMRATLIRKEASPGLIATDIRRIISQRLGERIPRYFVGRRAEIEQSLETISGFTDPNFRPPLIVYGLKGYRQTLACPSDCTRQPILFLNIAN